MANGETVESALDLVEEFNIVTAVSKKTEKPYQILELKFKGGVQGRFFLEWRDQRDFLKLVEEKTAKDSKFDLNK